MYVHIYDKMKEKTDKEPTTRYIMNLPTDIYEFLRLKAFQENTDIKTLIVEALKKEYISKKENQ